MAMGFERTVEFQSRPSVIHEKKEGNNRIRYLNTKSGQERRPAGLKDYMKGDSHFLQVKDQTGIWWERGAWEM